MPHGEPLLESAAQLGPPPSALAGRQRAENFPVALRVLPRARREDLLALYGFARWVDEIGDELEGDRMAALDAVDAELDRLFAGDTPGHPVVAALAPTVRTRGLSEAPLRRLVEANRIDQRVSRHATRDQLLDYCRYSANPVGELVLEIFGARSPERVQRSNAICTALQLAEHWQDVREDLVLRGRIYLPEEDRRAFEVSELALRATRAGPQVRALLRWETDWARALLREGAPLVGMLRGPARWAVAGFVAGGHAALDAIEDADGDVLRATPRPRRARFLGHLLRALVRSGRP